MAAAYLLGNGSAPLLAGALEVPFAANASACRPPGPPCTAAPPGAWGNSSAAAAVVLGWNRSEPCGGGNGSAGGGGPCAPAGGGPSVFTAIAIIALYSVVCVVGLFGNFLVMYVIVRYTKMKTATNIYIFNLALADALATSTLPFQSVNYLMGTWPFGTILCKIVISIDYYNMFTSIFTLCTMSVDRYVAVCHPVKALDFRTPRNAKIVNVCNWILSSAIGLPVMFMATTKYRHDENFKRCFREFCIPTSSTIEQQNSTRIRQNTRDHASTANTVDRTNHQLELQEAETTPLP
ncbi:mu-type opioid receptor isoform X2 [Myiozetetes cayanensis]|uniref:mu-type opioid receptor isoform X2 n=1 Tax=Myiozetetes cayanensis TaxID=478635 RepID=UPI00215DFD0F|nr:mu-type opioid receptor isoform X2 [Myiozetetes cayanensis]